MSVFHDAGVEVGEVEVYVCVGQHDITGGGRPWLRGSIPEAVKCQDFFGFYENHVR